MNTKNSTTRAVSKSMLNNLLGRFGLDINQSITDIVSEDKFNVLIQTKEVVAFHRFNNLVLVNYKETINYDICSSMNVDFKNTVLHNLKFNKDKEDRFDDVSIAISAAITSYARIEMSKVKLKVLQKGGKLYYTDTDSIVVDVPLDPELVGLELGQFKLEHEIIRGYFISGKTYCLITANSTARNESSCIIKAKGVDSSLLKELHFKRLLEGDNIKSYIKTSKRDLKKGYVNIMDSLVSINSDVYVKRHKILLNGK
jgi:hypothetical protein